MLNAYRVVYTVSEKNAVLQTENARLTEEINRLKEQLKLAQQNRFGKKSETGELPLPPETSETTDIHVPAHTRKKKTKGCLMDLAALPRHIIIPDNTLGNWVMQVGDALMPLYEALWEELLSSRYLQVDETPIKVLNPNKKGYLWVYYAPHLGGGLIAFEFDLTRKGAVAEQRLSPYQGLLQTDGYNGYEKLRQREDIEGLGCLTHARRKFAEVVKISKNPEGIAAEAIERLKPLYALEARMRDNQYAFHTRKRLRQKMALPILRDFKCPSGESGVTR